MSDSLCCPICESDEKFCRTLGCQDNQEKDMQSQKYGIKGGDSYHIKEDLKAFGCRWDASNKRWVTPDIAKGSVYYMRLKSLAQSSGAEFCPINLTGQAKAIQDILNK